MLLSDVDISSRLNEFAISAANPNFPFDVEKQLQPCSIDLRLSDIVWVPRRFRRIDLLDNTALGPQISRAFRKQRMVQSKGFLLKPGRFLLARTYERFAVPADLCGRLAGRSSAGRLGLTVAATCNFINPGWRGHMPIVLVNNSPFPVRIYPYIGIAQLYFAQLSSKPKRLYGDQGVGSKYNDDDGGPSKYWLDDTIAALRNSLQLRNSSPAAEKFLEDYARELDDPTRLRFVRFLRKYGFVGDGPDFASAFVQRERWRTPTTWLVGILASAGLSAAIRWVPELLGLGKLGWTATVPVAALLCVVFLMAYLRLFGTTMSPSELRKLIATIRAGQNDS